MGGDGKNKPTDFWGKYFGLIIKILNSGIVSKAMQILCVISKLFAGITTFSETQVQGCAMKFEPSRHYLFKEIETPQKSVKSAQSLQ